MNNTRKFFLLGFSIVLLIVGCAEKDEQLSILVDNASSADGVSIAYEVRGEGEIALVFVHGWCCDRSYWKEQLPHFSDKYKVVAIDLGGLGESGFGRTDWTLAAYGDDVAAVVEKLNLDKAVLIGHSMGGYVILEAERRIPERVIGLVSVDVFSNVEEKRTQEYLDKVYAPFQSNFEKAIRDSFSEFAEWGDPVLLEKLFACPPDMGRSSQRAYFNYLNNELTQALTVVQAPITCINRDSKPVNLEAARKYSTSFEVRYMSGVGHMLILEEPVTFNRLLEETIQEFVQIVKSN